MDNGQGVADFYAGDYNCVSLAKAVHIYQDKALRLLRRFNPGRKPLKLLDVGCEDGDFSVRIMGGGYVVYGLDIRAKEVAKAKKRGIRAVQGSAESRFPFASGSFDAVYAGDIIEHLYDTDFFIREVRRVLKQGGVFVVTTPNLASLSNRIRLLLGKLPVGSEIRIGRDMAGHIRNYTFPELECQLRHHGFSVVRKVSSNIMFPVRYNVPFKPLAIKLGDYFPNIGSHIIMVARKQ